MYYLEEANQSKVRFDRVNGGTVAGVTYFEAQTHPTISTLRPLVEHVGNVRYHALVDYYKDAYERARKFDKMKIAIRIVETVQEYGGRFLKQEGAGWLVVEDNDVISDKVSHAFRTLRTSALASSSLLGASGEDTTSKARLVAKVAPLSNRAGTNMAPIKENKERMEDIKSSAKRIKL